MRVYVSKVSVILRHMLQVFHLNVAYVVDTHMSQAYVPNVLSVLEVCCNKSSILQVFHEAHWQSTWGGRAPGDAAGRVDTGA
jgi:hypothetical protein